MFDSYNAEVAATQIKSIKLQNASTTYSRYNDIKFDLEDEEDRFTLYSSFIAFVTNGSSIVPESHYVYNDIRKELPNRRNHFTDSDEKVYINIRRSKGYTSELERVNRDDSDLSVTVDLKAAASNKMRLYIRGSYQTEYMYMLSKHGVTMQLKEYSVAKIKKLNTIRYYFKTRFKRKRKNFLIRRRRKKKKKTERERLKKYLE